MPSTTKILISPSMSHFLDYNFNFDFGHITEAFNSLDWSRLVDLLRYHPESPMLFNTGLFLLLFAAFMVVHEALRKLPLARMAAIIAFSLYFYYKASGWCCVLLCGICLCDYFLGLWMQRSDRNWVRRLIVFLNVVANVGMLIYFKYFNLLARTWAELRHGSFDAWDIILPAGISFITFRSISYIVDLYRREMEAERNLLYYTFNITFFPPLLAGPVVRARDLLPQIHRHPVATPEMVGQGFFLIMSGLVKKVIIADYISGNFVNRVFDNPSLYSGFENLMGAVGFTVQLYCDFSGYSDMAIGIALLMGYRFKDNFRAPFKAQNPTEFWHRWHISLSTWLRDYLYIPLGGSRKGRFRTYLNNFITMVLGGLWHGAGWMYLLWGGYHGALLAVHKFFKGKYRIPEMLKHSALLRAVNVAVTFTLVVIGFSIFRADSLDTLQAMAHQIIFAFHLDIAVQFASSYMLIVLAMAAAMAGHFAPQAWTTGMCTFYQERSIATQTIILAIVLFAVIQVSSSDLVPFIYLQY